MALSVIVETATLFEFHRLECSDLDIEDRYFTILGDVAGVIEICFDVEAVVDPLFELCEGMDVGVCGRSRSHQVQ